MKKLLLLLFILSYIQITKAQNITYGVKGGANFASFIQNFDAPLDYKYKLGYQIGGFVNIKLSDKFYLQPELLYSLQGAKFDSNFLSSVLPPILNEEPLFADNFSGTENHYNIILPITIQYFLSEKIKVSFGPQIDYLFHIAYDGFENTTVEDQNNVAEDSFSTSEFNLGLILGFGYDLNKKMGLELRYNYGFNHLFKGVLGNFDNPFKQRNSVFQLNFEYRIK